MARNVVLPYPPRTSACRERPVRTTLIFKTFRENVTIVRQTSPEGYSIRCGRSAFFIISVHHRHFCCSHFYCFGANRIKIAKSESSPNLCVHSSSSYVSPSMQPLSSGDLIEWSLVCHSTLSYQKFCDRHSNHYDHPEELHQSVE